MKINQISMRSLNSKAYWILSLVFFAFSCNVTQKYSRTDTEVVQDHYQFNNEIKEDGNMGFVSWRSIFSDSILNHHIELALVKNPNVNVSMNQIEIAVAYLKQGRAAFFPTVSIGPSVSYQTSSLNTQIGRIIGDRQHLLQYELSADLAWEADIWKKLKSNEAAASAAFKSSESALQTVQSELIASIANLYYRLLALDNQKAFIDSTIYYRTQSLETTKALKTAGSLTQVAVLQSEAQLLNAKAQYVEIEREIKLLENTFNLLLAMPSGTSVTRTNLESQKPYSELGTGVPADLLANRPDVRAAEYQLISAFELTNVSKASLYPTLRITASGGIQSIDIEKLFNINSLFGGVVAGLTQPVFNRRQLKTDVEVKQAQQEIAYWAYINTILNAQKDVSDALYAYETQVQLIELKSAEYANYALALEYSQELVNYGYANYLEVLRANENALNAKLAHIDAQYGKLNAIILLYKALGGGYR